MTVGIYIFWYLVFMEAYIFRVSDSYIVQSVSSITEAFILDTIGYMAWWLIVNRK